MSFIDDWGKAIADFGGALSTGLGISVDAARVSDEKLFGKDIAQGFQRKVAAPVMRGTQSGLGLLNVPLDAVDRVIATPLQAAYLIARNSYNRKTGELDASQEWHNLFNGDLWGQAWDRADKYTAGQSFADAAQVSAFNVQDRNKFLGMSDQQMADYRKDDNAYNIVTGGLDAAKTWYLDPLNVVGRGAGAARQAFIKAPIRPGANIAAEVEGAGRTGMRVQSIINNTHGWNAHQFYVGVEGLTETTQGMAIASALAKASKIENPAERAAQMKLVQRVMYGDQSAKAELAKAKPALMDQLAAAEKTTNDLLEANKWQEIGPNKYRYWDKPDIQDVYKQRVENARAETDRIKLEMDRLQELDTSGVFGSQRYRTFRVSEGSKGRAYRLGRSHFREAADSLAGPRWSQVTLRSSLWNVPIKLIAAPVRGAFNAADDLVTMALPGYLALHDPGSAKVLDAMMKSIRDFSPELRSSFVSRYIEAQNEGAKQAVLHSAEGAVFGHIAKKYGMDKADAAKLVNQYQMARMGFRNRAKLYAGIGVERSYSGADSATIQGGKADFITEDGQVVRAPFLETHLQNEVPMLNPMMVEHVMKRNVNKLTAINDWARRADAALSPSDASYFANNPRQALGAAALGVNAQYWGVGELLNDGLNLFNRVWKFGALFRLGYPLRNVTDEQLRIAAKLDSGLTQMYLDGAWNTARNTGRALTGANIRAARAAHSADIERFKELDDTISSIRNERKLLPQIRKDIADTGKRQAKDAQDFKSAYAKWKRERETAIASFDREAAEEPSLRGELGRVQRALQESSGEVARVSDQDVKLYRRDVAGAEMRGSQKPHGVYYSIEHKGFVSPFGPQNGIGPKGDVGDTDFRALGLKLDHKDVLKPPDLRRAIPGNLRGGGGTGGFPVDVDAGVSALHHLVGEKEFDRLWGMSKADIKAELSKKFPDVDWDKYYDGYEMLMAYGGILARKKGFKAIYRADRSMPNFSEYVALTDDATISAEERAAINKRHSTLATRQKDLTDRLDKLNTKRQQHEQFLTAHTANEPQAPNPNDYSTDTLQTQHDAIQAKVDQLEPLLSEHKALATKLDLAKKQGVRAIYRPEKYKTGTADITLPDGSVISGPFAGDEGELHRKLAEANGLVQRQIHQGENNSLARMTGAGDWVDIEPHEPGHTEAWLDAMNMHIRQSVMARMVLEGSTDREILEFLKTPAGRALTKRLPHHAANKADWIANVRSHVESYVPTPELRATLLERQVKGEDIADLIRDKKAPTVNGPSLEHALGNGPVANVINRVMDQSMKLLGDMPADKLSRHPFYTALYQQRAKDEAAFLLMDPGRMDLGKRMDALDQEDLAHIKKVSHAYALHEMKSTLYDISAHSNLAQHMRFMSPFMGAWQETLQRWWNLTQDKPQILNYFQLGWQLPNKMGIVVDREGNPVDESNTIKDDEFLVMRLPPWAGSKQLKIFDSVPYIPKSAFNLTLQGDPWWLPGFGPLVQMAVGKFQTKVPDLDSMAQFVNPYGPPKDVLDAISPATVKRFRSWYEKTAAKDYGQANYRIYNQMLIDWDKGGREGPEPTWQEAQKRTDSLFILRAVNNFLNPFPANFRSPYQFYIDSYHVLQEQARQQGQDPSWVDDQFIKKYGDTYFLLAQSMSKNNAGADPTAEWVNAYKGREQVVKDYPEFADEIVGYHPGEFNSSAYNYQLQEHYEPGTDKTVRSLKSPKEAQQDNEARLGWHYYKKLTDKLDAVAAELGYDSYRDNGGLMAAKRAYVQKLIESNPAWAAKYRAAASADQFDLKMPELEKVANDKRLLSDPSNTGIRTLQKYMHLRKTFAQVLAQQEHTTPQAQSNQPLMRLYTNYVNQLVESDTQFSRDWYSGNLEFDPMLVDPLEVTLG